MWFSITVVFSLFIFSKESKLKNIETVEIIYVLEFSVKTSLKLSLSYNKYSGYLCVTISNSVEASPILPQTCVLFHHKYAHTIKISYSLLVLG